MRSQSVFVFLLMITSGCLFAQATKPSVRIEGEVLTPLTLTMDDLAKLPPQKVVAKDRDGKEHEYTGVALHEVLKLAGVTLGAQLRGENLAKYVRIKAADGYEVIYSLAEVDPEFTNQVVLLATQVDNSPLPKGEGPFRMVAPGDKKHARWIREISSIKILFAKE